MIYKITASYRKFEELIEFVETGILFIHRRESGGFLMLSQSIRSYLEKNQLGDSNYHNLYSIDDEHPMFNRIFRLYQLHHLPALLVIKNYEVKEVVVGPISKLDLLKCISINGVDEKI